MLKKQNIITDSLDDIVVLTGGIKLISQGSLISSGLDMHSQCIIIY